MKFIGCIILVFVVTQTLGQDAKCKDGHPNKKKPSLCCFPPMPSEEIFDKCEELYKVQTEKQDKLEIVHGCCISECTLNETQIYKGDGILDIDALNKLLLENATSEWESIIPKVVDQCFKAAEESEEFFKTFDTPPAFAGEKVCHPISGFVLLCIFNQGFQECPASIFPKGDAECDALKKYSETCPLIPS